MAAAGVEKVVDAPDVGLHRGQVCLAEDGVAAAGAAADAFGEFRTAGPAGGAGFVPHAVVEEAEVVPLGEAVDDAFGPVGVGDDLGADRVELAARGAGGRGGV